MTEKQLKEIGAIKEQLREIYWELVDNKEAAASKRVDTIIGKISTLEDIYKNN